MANNLLRDSLADLRSAGFSHSAMLDTGADLSRRVALSKILHYLLHHPTPLTHVVVSAVRHANGFQKIVLAADGNAQIRLHIWLPVENTSERLVENAHNHRWPFATTILYGSYTATTLTTVGGDRYSQCIYSPTKDPANYELVEVGQCDLMPTDISTYSRGSAYWVESTVIHRVSPINPQEFTATLVVVAPAKRFSTDVFVARQPNVAAVGDSKHRALGSSEIAYSMRLLAHMLDIDVDAETDV